MNGRYLFGKRPVANTHVNGERQSLSVDPTAGYVNSRIVQRTNLQARKRNSLLNLDFFRICGTV
jgi:hypothetical protein